MQASNEKSIPRIRSSSTSAAYFHNHRGPVIARVDRDGPVLRVEPAASTAWQVQFAADVRVNVPDSGGLTRGMVEVNVVAEGLRNHVTAVGAVGGQHR